MVAVPSVATGMAQAMLREGHHIHVALHHPDLAGRPNRLAPLEESVERLAFDEEWRSRES